MSASVPGPWHRSRASMAPCATRDGLSLRFRAWQRRGRGRLLVPCRGLAEPSGRATSRRRPLLLPEAGYAVYASLPIAATADSRPRVHVSRFDEFCWRLDALRAVAERSTPPADHPRWPSRTAAWWRSAMSWLARGRPRGCDPVTSPLLGFHTSGRSSPRPLVRPAWLSFMCPGVLLAAEPRDSTRLLSQRTLKSSALSAGPRWSPSGLARWFITSAMAREYGNPRACFPRALPCPRSCWCRGADRVVDPEASVHFRSSFRRPRAERQAGAGASGRGSITNVSKRAGADGLLPR